MKYGICIYKEANVSMYNIFISALKIILLSEQIKDINYTIHYARKRTLDK